MMNITSTFCENAKINPNKTAVHTNERSITYQALDEKTDTIAHALLESDSTNNENMPLKAAILLSNQIECMEVLLGSAKAGWTAVTFDPKWSHREILAVVEQTKPAILFIDSSFSSLIDILNKKVRVIVCGESYENWISQFEMDPIYLPQEDFSDRPFYMGFTSGTTGLPKGFMRSHESWTTSFRESDKEIQLESTDNISVPGPLVHSLFLFAALHTLHLGATCFLEKTFSGEKLKEKIKTSGITVMYGVPTIYEALFSSVTEPDTKEFFLRKCILSGDKWSCQRKKDWSRMLPNTEWISFYGSSELSFVAILSHADQDKRENGIGYPFSTVEISIRNHTGEEAAEGEAGELFARSPMVFSGYHQEKPVQPGEWISSGDIVWSEKDGFLNLAGRKKNKIVTGGLNVFPEEVENLLLSHSMVKNAVVTGLDDRYWGEKMAALLVVHDQPYKNEEELIEQLKRYCKNHLAAYKCPRQWMTASEVPLTTSGKPARKKIQERFAEERQ
ncbi:hypothetical protein D7Z54_27150 [Salibacterium salarium]|uniref:Long-chain acyl-CoA synthetase n=1 Tax=Salibacterium salarium TaxID=284579 RepID=A0A3R9P4I1_9BACI|nr:AMP-binding protein [Salibacterium salarium]RSL30173.1 hypothetical protein D7Z54_27150 [Salibacterium salarium]